MKKYILLYLIIVLFILTGFIMYVNTQEIILKNDVDYVAVNEITKQAAMNWHTPDQLEKIDFKYRFTILDDTGLVIYTSDKELPDNLPAAVKKGFLPVNIQLGTGITGVVLIETFIDDELIKTQAKISKITLTAFLLLGALSLMFLAAFYNTLIKPLRRMEVFAHKISDGKFDEPLPMKKNNLFGSFTQSFDIMRETLLTTRQNQLKAEKAHKELIASLAHDIKTPITTIRAISEYLRIRFTDTAITEKLLTIEAYAGKIDRLVNDLLSSSIEQLGELKVNSAAVESSVLHGLFHDADHLSKVKIGSIPDCLIEIDTIRMGQVIENIITNSYKYAGTDIEVNFEICGEFLQIDIKDYGKGPKQEHLELIFTKFFRSENAKALQTEGEGLGLYIAGLLMEKMGGGIEAFNSDNGFTVRLLVMLSH